MANISPMTFPPPTDDVKVKIEEESSDSEESGSETESESDSDSCGSDAEKALEYSLLHPSYPPPEYSPLSLAAPPSNAFRQSWINLRSRQVGGIPMSDYIRMPCDRPVLQPGQRLEDYWTERTKKEMEELELDEFLLEDEEDIKPSLEDLEESVLGMKRSPPDTNAAQKGFIVKKEEELSDEALLQGDGIDATNTLVAYPSQMVQMAISRLHQAAQRVKGCFIKWDLIESQQPPSKQAILKILRPDGSSKTYANIPSSIQKKEARAQTASLAILNGALDFIATGNPNPEPSQTQDSQNRHQIQPLILSSQHPDSQLSSQGKCSQLTMLTTLGLDQRDDIQQIENYFLQHHTHGSRNLILKMCTWYHIRAEKDPSRHGYALHIFFSKTELRVYSCAPIMDTPEAAKAACARTAVEDGVLEYIKEQAQSKNRGEPIPEYSLPTSVDSFLEMLPKPLPDDMEGKNVMEINPPVWYNGVIQSARGTKMEGALYYFTSGESRYQGCLLRVTRQIRHRDKIPPSTTEEVKNYIVPAIFHKRSDAKAAVCLQAISCNLKAYIDGVRKELETKVTSGMRQFANSKLYPGIAAELEKLNGGKKIITSTKKANGDPNTEREANTGLVFEYTTDIDTFGCSITVSFSPPENDSSNTPTLMRTYSVPPDYRSKPDAKIAVGCLAAQEGVIEFLKFRGKEPTRPWTPSFALEASAVIAEQKTGVKPDVPAIIARAEQEQERENSKGAAKTLRKALTDANIAPSVGTKMNSSKKRHSKDRDEVDGRSHKKRKTEKSRREDSDDENDSDDGELIVYSKHGSISNVPRPYQTGANRVHDEIYENLPVEIPSSAPLLPQASPPFPLQAQSSASRLFPYPASLTASTTHAMSSDDPPGLHSLRAPQSQYHHIGFFSNSQESDSSSYGTSQQSLEAVTAQYFQHPSVYQQHLSSTQYQNNHRPYEQLGHGSGDQTSHLQSQFGQSVPHPVPEPLTDGDDPPGLFLSRLGRTLQSQSIYAQSNGTQLPPYLIHGPLVPPLVSESFTEDNDEPPGLTYSRRGHPPTSLPPYPYPLPISPTDPGSSQSQEDPPYSPHEPYMYRSVIRAPEPQNTPPPLPLRQQLQPVPPHPSTFGRLPIDGSGQPGWSGPSSQANEASTSQANVHTDQSHPVHSHPGLSSKSKDSHKNDRSKRDDDRRKVKRRRGSDSDTSGREGKSKFQMSKLFAFCAEHRLHQPKFFHELTRCGEYRVWVEMGDEHLELPNRPVSLEIGQQKLAKKVLARLLSKMEQGWAGG